MISNLPDTGCYPVPGGWAGLGPTSGLGVVDTACPVPFVEPYWNVYHLLHSGWGQGCVWHQGLKTCRQDSANLVFSWCWGSPRKARSWQCSLLAPEHPQQCAVDPEGMSPDRCLCDALEGKELTLKVFRVCSGTFLYFTARETNFP